MSEGLNISVDVHGDADLQRHLDRVTGPNARRELHQWMTEQVKELYREHLVKLSGERHNKLGAESSRHFEMAAKSVEDAVIDLDMDSGSFTLNYPGLSRAFHPVTIEPVEAESLAIPVNALAYNRQPSQFAPDAFFIFTSRTTGNSFLAMRQDRQEKDQPLELMYLLVRSLTQDQDPTLAPTPEEMEEAARGGAIAFFDQEIPA